MAGQRTPRANARPKGPSLAERAEECAARQRRLKQEAAERRAAAKAREADAPSAAAGGQG